MTVGTVTLEKSGSRLTEARPGSACFPTHRAMICRGQQGPRSRASSKKKKYSHSEFLVVNVLGH